MVETGSHMSPKVGNSLSVIIQGENSQRILLIITKNERGQSPTSEIHRVHKKVDNFETAHTTRSIFHPKAILQCCF